MICQLSVTAGVDLKLGHSCPREPYRASIFVFLAERDNLSVPWGPRQNGWDHLTPDHPWGIWGMVLSLRCAHPTGEVSSLNFVYLLAPCRENLPHQLHVNLVTKLAYNFLLLSLLKPPTQPPDKFMSFIPLLIAPSFLSLPYFFLLHYTHLVLSFLMLLCV